MIKINDFLKLQILRIHDLLIREYLGPPLHRMKVTGLPIVNLCNNGKTYLISRSFEHIDKDKLLIENFITILDKNEDGFKIRKCIPLPSSLPFETDFVTSIVSNYDGSEIMLGCPNPNNKGTILRVTDKTSNVNTVYEDDQTKALLGYSISGSDNLNVLVVSVPMEVVDDDLTKRTESILILERKHGSLDYKIQAIIISIEGHLLGAEVAMASLGNNFYITTPDKEFEIYRCEDSWHGNSNYLTVINIKEKNNEK